MLAIGRVPESRRSPTGEGQDGDSNVAERPTVSIPAAEAQPCSCFRAGCGRDHRDGNDGRTIGGGLWFCNPGSQDNANPGYALLAGARYGGRRRGIHARFRRGANSGCNDRQRQYQRSRRRFGWQDLCPQRQQQQHQHLCIWRRWPRDARVADRRQQDRTRITEWNCGR